MGTIDCSSILLMGLGTLMICIIVFDAEFLYDWYEKKIQKIVQNEIYQKQYYRIAKRTQMLYSYLWNIIHFVHTKGIFHVVFR